MSSVVGYSMETCDMSTMSLCIWENALISNCDKMAMSRLGALRGDSCCWAESSDLTHYKESEIYTLLLCRLIER